MREWEWVKDSHILETKWRGAVINPFKRTERKNAISLFIGLAALSLAKVPLKREIA